MAKQTESHSKYVLLIVGAVVVFALLVVFMNKPAETKVGKGTESVTYGGIMYITTDDVIKEDITGRKELHQRCSVYPTLEIFKGVPEGCKPFYIRKVLSTRIHLHERGYAYYDPDGDFLNYEDDGEINTDCKYCTGGLTVRCQTQLRSEENKKKVEDDCKEKCARYSTETHDCGGYIGSMEDEENPHCIQYVDHGHVQCSGKFMCYCALSKKELRVSSGLE